MDILDRLNSYTGLNVWEDVIKDLPGYDEAATEEIDPGCANDRFVAGGVVYAWDVQTRQWYEKGWYEQE